MRPDSKSKYGSKSKLRSLMRPLRKETSEILFPILFTGCSGNSINQVFPDAVLTVNDFDRKLLSDSGHPAEYCRQLRRFKRSRYHGWCEINPEDGTHLSALTLDSAL